MIPLRIDPLFWLMAFGIGWLYSGSFEGMGIWAMIILISVFVHEMGHALTAKSFGQKSAITLTVYGGVTQRFGPSLSPLKEFIVVLNGPLAGFCLYLIALSLLNVERIAMVPLAKYILEAAALANLFWTFLNLLPIQPLDGGHLLLITVKSIFGIKSVRFVYLFSTVFAACVTSFFIYAGNMIGGAIFVLFAFESYRAYQQSKLFTKVDENKELQEELKSALSLLREGDIESARQRLENVRKKSGAGSLYIAATEKLSDLHEESKEFEQSYRLLEPLQKKLEFPALLKLQRAAFLTKRYKEAIAIGEKLHREEANKEVALINAYSHAVLKERVPAFGWLKTAERDGLEDPEAALRSPYFKQLQQGEGSFRF